MASTTYCRMVGAIFRSPICPPSPGTVPFLHILTPKNEANFLPQTPNAAQRWEPVFRTMQCQKEQQTVGKGESHMENKTIYHALRIRPIRTAASTGRRTDFGVSRTG